MDIRLSVVRHFNATKQAKTRNLLAARPLCTNTAKMTEKVSPPSRRIQSRHIKDWIRGRPARTFAAHLTLSMHKSHARNADDGTIFCSQQRPIGGKIRIENTTINQYNLSIDILGAALSDSGGIGQLWLSKHHTLSAAHFVRVFTWLIVMNCVFSSCTCPMKLKLSQMKHIGVGQPRTCACLGLQMRSGQERGSPW